MPDCEDVLNVAFTTASLAEPDCVTLCCNVDSAEPDREDLCCDVEPAEPDCVALCHVVDPAEPMVSPPSAVL